MGNDFLTQPKITPHPHLHCLSFSYECIDKVKLPPNKNDPISQRAIFSEKKKEITRYEHTCFFHDEIWIHAAAEKCQDVWIVKER